jgi:hypothetical protein
MKSSDRRILAKFLISGNERFVNRIHTRAYSFLCQGMGMAIMQSNTCTDSIFLFLFSFYFCCLFDHCRSSEAKAIVGKVGCVGEKAVFEVTRPRCMGTRSNLNVHGFMYFFAQASRLGLSIFIALCDKDWFIRAF